MLFFLSCQYVLYFSLYKWIINILLRECMYLIGTELSQVKLVVDKDQITLSQIHDFKFIFN